MPSLRSMAGIISMVSYLPFSILGWVILAGCLASTILTRHLVNQAKSISHMLTTEVQDYVSSTVVEAVFYWPGFSASLLGLAGYLVGLLSRSPLLALQRGMGS